MSVQRLAAVVACAVLGAPSASAVVSEDIRWSPANGPVHVHSTLVIDTFGSLTIEPGVEVLFHERASLVVRGPLSATGTGGAPVRFAPLDPAAGWGGVRVEGGDALLAHVVIEGARTGLTAAGGSTTLVDARVQSCGTLVASEGTARLRVLDSELIGASGTGLAVGTGTRVVAQGVRLLGCRTGADVATDATLELGASDVGRHEERGLVVSRGARVAVDGCAIHDTPLALETLEAAGLAVSGSAFACNGLDVAAAVAETVNARGNFWGTTGLTSGPVDQRDALDELPEPMRDFERLHVERDGGGVRFEWSSVADCGAHVVLWAGSPDGELSETAGEPQPLADGRTVELFALRTVAFRE